MKHVFHFGDAVHLREHRFIYLNSPPVTINMPNVAPPPGFWQNVGDFFSNGADWISTAVPTVFWAVMISRIAGPGVKVAVEQLLGKGLMPLLTKVGGDLYGLGKQKIPAGFSKIRDAGNFAVIRPGKAVGGKALELWENKRAIGAMITGQLRKEVKALVKWSTLPVWGVPYAAHKTVGENAAYPVGKTIFSPVTKSWEWSKREFSIIKEKMGIRKRHRAEMSDIFKNGEIKSEQAKREGQRRRAGAKAMRKREAAREKGEKGLFRYNRDKLDHLLTDWAKADDYRYAAAA